MILYRCGHFSDNTLSKGNYWSNFITECKPYYRGKISVIEIQLDERYHKRYMLSKELKTLGSHDGWGEWLRVYSQYDEAYDQKYYYISKEYLEKYSKVICEYTGEKSLSYLNKKLKEESKIIKKYC